MIKNVTPFLITKIMALELKLSKTGITSTTDRIFLRDTTGDYEAVDNPGGYGTPNPDRNTLALVLTGFQKRSNEDIDVEFVVYDPETVTDWEGFTPADGWYLFNMYGLQLFAQNTTTEQFQVNEIVWNNVTQELYKILTITEVTPTDWTYTFEVVEASALDDPTNIKAHEAILNTWTLGKTFILHSKLLKRFFADPNNAAFKDEYFDFDALLKSTQYSFGFSNFTEAQLKVEHLEGFEECVADITCDLAENIA